MKEQQIQVFTEAIKVENRRWRHTEKTSREEIKVYLNLDGVYIQVSVTSTKESNMK
jgi:hypothetical protein